MKNVIYKLRLWVLNNIVDPQEKRFASLEGEIPF